MRPFLRKIRSFGLVVLGFLLVMTLANAALRSLDGPWLGPNVRTLILGDSHAKSSFDPAVIPASFNAAQEGEPMAATYYKLQALLDENPTIDTVLLSIAPHNFSWMQDVKFAIERWGPKMYERYIEVLPWPTIPGVRESYLARITAGLQVFVFPNPEHLINLASRTREYRYVGGFETGPPRALIPEYLEKRLPHLFGPATSPHPPAKVMPRYLKRIAELVVERDARFILVRTPVHPDYHARIPESYRSRFDEVVQEVARRDGVRYLDLSQMPLEEVAFGNYDHVCSIGAREVSLAIAAFLGRDRPKNH